MRGETGVTTTLHVGWIEDGTIPEAIERLDTGSEAIWFYISLVDSTPDVHASPMLRKLLDRDAGTSRFRLVGTGVAVSPEEMRRMLSADFFSGFDEVWMCRRVPEQPKPPEVGLTSEIPVYDRRLGPLGRWMIANDCLVGLGDGVGLNFVTFAGGHAGRLIGDRSPGIQRVLSDASS